MRIVDLNSLRVGKEVKRGKRKAERWLIKNGVNNRPSIIGYVILLYIVDKLFVKSYSSEFVDAVMIGLFD